MEFIRAIKILSISSLETRECGEKTTSGKPKSKC